MDQQGGCDILTCVRQYFSGYFDTTVGLKTESASYKNIAQLIGKENDTKSILFVTDNIHGRVMTWQAKSTRGWHS